jgi:hypothetical protein
MGRGRWLLALVLSVMLAGCSTGSTPRPVQPAVAPVSSAHTSPNIPARSGLVAGAGLRAIDAVSSNRLVGLWSARRGRSMQAWLATSVDGGSHWRVAGTAIPVSFRTYPLPAVAFTSIRRGAVLVGGVVLTTANGGAIWQRASLPRHVFSLSIGGGVAWASSLVCDGGHDGKCGVTVSTDDFGGGGGWGTSTARVPVSRHSNPIVLQSGASTGLVYLSGDDPNLLAEVTNDRGNHWRVAGAPCAGRTRVRVGHGRTIESRWDALAGLAAPAGPAPDWWAVCGGGAAAGTETKGLEISSDDGGTWSQISAFPSIAPYRNPANLPAGDFAGLLAATGGDLLMATPNYLATSADRGATWQGVRGINLGGVSVSMTSDKRGTIWVLAPGLDLWRGSVDRSWHALYPSSREKYLVGD